jgi:hypothetical protein
MDDEVRLALQRGMKLEQDAREILEFVNLPYPESPGKSAAPGKNFLAIPDDEPLIEHDGIGNANADASDEDKYRRDQLMTAKAGELQSLLMCAVVLLACS